MTEKVAAAVLPGGRFATLAELRATELGLVSSGSFMGRTEEELLR